MASRPDEPDAPSTRSGTQGSPNHLVLLAFAAGAFGSLDTALNIAFPDLVDDLELQVGDLQWVVVTYVLSFGSLLLGAGHAGDRLGHRRAAAIGGGISTVALAGCAAAPNLATLLVARVGQGIGAALVMAAAPALLTTRRPKGASGTRAIGVFQAAAATGLAIGPILGGPLVEAAGWQAVFWFRVPLGLAVVALAFTAAGDDDANPIPPVHEESDSAGDARPTDRTGNRARRQAEGPTRAGQQGSTPAPAGMDLAGVAALSIAIASAVLSVNLGQLLGWADAAVIGGWVACALALWGYAAASRRAANPLLDLDLLRNTNLKIALGLSVVANGAMFATWLLVPALLIDRVGTSAVVGGFVLAASPVATTLISRPAARLAIRVGPSRPTVAGLAIEAAAMAGLGFADASWSPWIIAAGLGAVGIGLGTFTVPNMALVMDSMPGAKQGVAAGLSLMTRTIGVVAGVAAASGLYEHFEPLRGADFAHRVVFLASAGVLLAATAVTGAARIREQTSQAGTHR